jgi:hypothetical protein
MRHVTSRLISVYPSHTRVVNNCLTNAPIIRPWAFLAAWLMPEPRGCGESQAADNRSGLRLPHQDRLSLISVSPAGDCLQALVTPSQRGDDSTRSPAYLPFLAPIVRSVFLLLRCLAVLFTLLPPLSFFYSRHSLSSVRNSFIASFIRCPIVLSRLYSRLRHSSGCRPLSSLPPELDSLRYTSSRWHLH